MTLIRRILRPSRHVCYMPPEFKPPDGVVSVTEMYDLRTQGVLDSKHTKPDPPENRAVVHHSCGNLANNTAQYYNLSLLVQEQERFLLTARLILGVASRTF
ncbi:MAG TPA: hypothetical protein VNO24_03535 [Blastocatellia bacterium]|nr:hypothetical protein [Blastocatellia bacterium]